MAIRRVEKPSRLWLIAGAAAVLALGGYFVWHHFSNRESTDDAQVSGHVSPVSSRVAGIAKAVHVKDNQAVHAGDVLVELDPRDYEIALARAEADLEAAKAGARAARTSVPIASTTTRSTLNVAETQTSNAESAVHAAERELDAAKARVTTARAKAAEAAAIANRAAQDLERLKPLLAKDEISKQQYDAAVAADQAARSSAAAAESAIAEANANVEVVDARRQQAEGALKQAKSNASAASTGPEQVALTEARAAGADAQVQQAQAAVDQAKLNLDRATVRAPADGVVSKKSIEPGQLVQPGQPLMALTSLGDVWVTANFKETQLRDMRAGQRVDVSVDAFGRTYHGRVDSIAAATGATFSLLPPDNASGNYVKVVQRVPVKIVLDDAKSIDAQLRPGMSVSATVYVR
jgi:membrane fusion protein (multidrug efflux system)